ncbi:peptide deformylase [Streptomyces sp. NPDC054765]
MRRWLKQDAFKPRQYQSNTTVVVRRPYLAAYDVHRAGVFGRCEPRTSIRPFMNLVTQVMTTGPYASAGRVFWIVDNGSSHRGKKAIDRLAKAFPKAVMVHTPVHASWTNQVELFFSIVQRKVVSPDDFPDLSEGASAVVLLNPRITDRSDETDEQFEGCLSFFDVRGLVPRPLKITVETTALAGETVTTVYERGLARLVHHEIDHLDCDGRHCDGRHGC